MSDAIWTGKCSECHGDGDTRRQWKMGDGAQGYNKPYDLCKPCPHCKEGKVMLGVPCEKCEGSMVICTREQDCTNGYRKQFKQYCMDAQLCEQSNPCTCTDGYRPLTEREVEDMGLITDEHRKLNIVDRLLATTMARHISGEIKLTFKGSPVKVLPCQ